MRECKAASETLATAKSESSGTNRISRGRFHSGKTSVLRWNALPHWLDPSQTAARRVIDFIAPPAQHDWQTSRFITNSSLQPGETTQVTPTSWWAKNRKAS